MAASIIQTSFAAGELSENLFARVDLDKYQIGLARCRNWFVDYRGGASTRAGTEFIDRTKNASERARLIPFVVSQEQSYVLEFGDQYIRFFTNGGALLETGVAISNISQANPAVVTAPGHGYATGEDVFINGVTGMTEVNGKTYRIVVLNVNQFSLVSLTGVPIDSSLYMAYVTGGLSYRVYEIASPWTEADLPLLKFVQSADVMTITRNGVAPHDLARTTPSVFTLTAVVVGPSLPATTIVNVVPTVAGAFTFGYVIVAVTAEGELGEASAIMTGDSAPLDPTHATPKVNAIYWNAVTGADVYNIYKYGPVLNSQPQPTVLGLIGQTKALEFTDINIGADFSQTPPEFRDPFAGSNYPGCVSYFQQRRAYGNFDLAPQQIDMSKVAAFDNFDVSLTVNDSDALKLGISSLQVNAIKAMVPMSSGLVILTSGGAFQISGGSPTAAITPSSVVALPQASSGANDLPPIVINYDILFVQNKGAIVRDLAYNFYLQTYYGFDRSALSNHLFFGHTLVEWTYAEEPFKIVWATRNDGRLLSMTYVPEQEVYGWGRHDTQGKFESVCSVPEGQEDAVYFIVQRIQADNTRARFIERMASRKFIRVEDTWSMDCGLTRYLDRPAYGLSMDANVTQAFLQAVPATPVFDASWIDRILWFDVGGKLKVVTVASPNQLICDILQPLGNAVPNTFPESYFNVDAGTWQQGAEIDVMTGLEHLEGKAVAVLADGQSLGPLVVEAGGVLPIGQFASKITIGLAFQAQLQTLKIDVGDPTVQGKQKKIAAVTLRLDQARALKVGDSFTTLYQIKEQPAGPFTPPLPLFSRDERIVINGSWNTSGQLCIQQDDPYPATVLGAIPEVIIGDTQR